MAIGVNSLLNMGVGALFASQANIQVTGNNISNVNTSGYSRQGVVLQERYSINYNPGQIGQGVQATEVIRYFDSFLERNYVQKLSSASRYATLHDQLSYVQNLINEANVDGTSSALSGFFKSWNALIGNSDNAGTREALLGSAQTLVSGIRDTADALKDLESSIDKAIEQDVATANQLMQEIAQLNKQIATSYQAGRNNPNQLMDARDGKVRELSTIIDVTINDSGPGDYRLTMKNGTPLVENEIAYSLETHGPRVEKNLINGSNYASDPTATLHFEGTDHLEYTVEIVDDGPVGTSGGATFKVSVDGGRTWLTDDSGQVRIFDANEAGEEVKVGNLSISFDAGDLSTGDRFIISPKTDVYWNSTTAGLLNISTQVYGDGSDNGGRITGGSLGGYLDFRDNHLGEYRERLDAFASALAWEVNKIHSSGAGLTSVTSMNGTTSVPQVDQPLGSPNSGFFWGDNLQSGNLSFSVFDPSTGQQVIEYPGISVFMNENFDPSQMTLTDVAEAINAADDNDYIVAEIVDGKLNLRSVDPEKYSFAISSDTTGLAAGLGLNTFFTGTSAGDLSIREELTANLNLICAGAVNGSAEINANDSETARKIGQLAEEHVSIGKTLRNKSTPQSLSGYYSSIVVKVGSDTKGAYSTGSTQASMAKDLYERQEEKAGVNLDEEMTNLIKFQASYKAAAKMITTADEMIQTLLSLKQ